jgi:hypothetical protein
MTLCPHEKCKWFHEDRTDKRTGERIHRKCYYEPGCWRGQIDVAIFAVKLNKELNKKE